MDFQLMKVNQFPVNPSILQALQSQAEHHLADARSLVCTPGSLSAVKSRRAEVQKEYYFTEEWRKAIKRWAMEEYNRFEADYKVATDGIRKALSIYSGEIRETEESIKKDCEDGLRDYFTELCAVHHLDWLTYERAGIKVDMASAKSKTPKKLREQLAAFVERVSRDVALIDRQEHAPEIMLVYKVTLDAADAIGTVQEYRRQVVKEMAEKEAREAAEERDAEMVRRVEVLAPPVVVEVQESVEVQEIVKIRYMDFRAHGTMEQLSALKRFALENNIKLEVIKNE